MMYIKIIIIFVFQLIYSQSDSISTILNVNVEDSSISESIVTKNLNDGVFIKENDSLPSELISHNSDTLYQKKNKLIVENIEVINQEKTIAPDTISNSSTVGYILLIIFLLLIIVGGLFLYQEFRSLEYTQAKLVDHVNKEFSERKELSKKINELVSHINQIRQNESIPNKNKNSNESIANHELAVWQANEIFRSKKNSKELIKDNDTIEAKKIERSIDQMESNLNKNGYEIVDLTGTPYSVELKDIRVVNTLTNKSYEPGKRVITKVIKPRVKYNGEIINISDVEVTESSSDKNGD